MLTLIRLIVAVVLLGLERIKGPKQVYEIKRPGNEMGCLKGFTVRGYELAIYCQRKEYHVKYDRWYIPNRIKVTYNVFSRVTNDAPKALQKACELDIDLPGLIHNWHFNDEIRHAQIDAYLDLLEARMKQMT